MEGAGEGRMGKEGAVSAPKLKLALFPELFSWRRRCSSINVPTAFSDRYIPTD